MRKLVIHFAGEDEIELFETLFIHPLLDREQRCIRGKRSGAYRDHSTFQWTKAVRALSVLIVEAAIRSTIPSAMPLLAGSTGTLASSLDYAIDKQTQWLFEMFGWTTDGGGLSRRLFIRSNPGQRMPGPVAISLNLNYLSPVEIEIYLNYERLTETQSLLDLKNRLTRDAAKQRTARQALVVEAKAAA